MATDSGWVVEFLDIADKEMQQQPDLIYAKFQELLATIREEGFDEISSRRIKKLTGKIWEMRVWGKNTTARALYLQKIGRRVIIVHVFTKKTQKTERHHINIALKRAKEFGHA